MTKALLNQSMLDKLNQKYAPNQNSKFNNDDKVTFYSLRGYGRYILRLMPMTKDMNGMLGKFVGTHFNMPEDAVSGKTTFYPCVESYDVPNAICPICEAFRELKNKGIDTSSFWKNKASTDVALKVLMFSTPDSEKDRTQLPCKVSILRIPGKAFKNLVEYYQDSLTPDLLDPNVGCAIVFSRKEGDKGWSLTHLDSSLPQSGILGGSEEIRDKLLKENESLVLDNLFKLPTDEKMMQIKNSAIIFKKQVLGAKQEMDSTVDYIAQSGAVLSQTTYQPLPQVQQQQFVQQQLQVAQQQIPIVNPFTPMTQQPIMGSEDKIPFNGAVSQVQQVVNTPVQTANVVNNAVNTMVQNTAQTVELNFNSVEQKPLEKQVQNNDSSLPYPTSVPGIDENNFTPQQKAILDKYRDGCTHDCFGCLSKYNLKGADQKCIRDPFSANCATAIQELYGVNVPISF